MSDDFEEQLADLVREATPWETPERIIALLRKTADALEAEPDAFQEGEAEDEDGA